MTIGINGNEANVSHRVGINQYAFELLTSLAKLSSPETSFQIYLQNEPLADMPKSSNHWHYKVFGPGKLWTLTGLQKKLLQEKVQGLIPDVFFSLTHYTPFYIPTKSVLAIMDVSYEKFPGYFKKKDLYQLRYWSRLSIRNTNKVITISNDTKKEICSQYGLAAKDVVVTYPGFDEGRFNSNVVSQKSKISNVMNKYGIKKPYLIFLGTLQPRKNLTRLIEAFSQLDDKDLQLVIVGMKTEGRGGWMFEQFFAKVESLGIKDRVIFTGFAPDDDVPYLFAGSVAFVFPSLYEGFGIPPIEAMATGVPVVVSKVSSLPEICGPNVIYIENPYDVENIRFSLQKILEMKQVELVKTTALGLKWVKRYNWDETAKETLKVLYDVAKR